jgi:hypothetical protein
VPSVSILAEPKVAIVDKNVDAKGTRASPRLPRAALHAGSAADHRPPLLSSAASGIRRSRRSRALPRGEAGHHRRRLRRLGQGAAEHFGDGGVFDRSIGLAADRAEIHEPPSRPGMAVSEPSIIPGFGLTFGFTIFYLA